MRNTPKAVSGPKNPTLAEASRCDSTHGLQGSEEGVYLTFFRPFPGRPLDWFPGRVHKQKAVRIIWQTDTWTKKKKVLA
jgi:hypothetical protein